MSIVSSAGSLSTIITSGICSCTGVALIFPLFDCFAVFEVVPIGEKCVVVLVVTFCLRTLPLFLIILFTLYSSVASLLKLLKIRWVAIFSCCFSKEKRRVSLIIFVFFPKKEIFNDLEFC